MEGVIGVIRGLKGGAAGENIYDVFFTEKTAVAAIVLHHSDLTDIYLKPDPLAILVGNRPRQREIKMRSLRIMDERRLTFENISLDEILTLHRANVEIDYQDIASVTIRKSRLATSLEFVIQRYPEKKMVFSLERSQIAEVERIVNRVLPNKLK